MAKEKDTDPQPCTAAFMASGLLREMYRHHSGGAMDATEAGHPLSKEKRDKDAEPLARDMSDHELEMLFREEVATALKAAGFTRENGKKAKRDDDEAWAGVYSLHRNPIYGAELMGLATGPKWSALLSSTDTNRMSMLNDVAAALGLQQQEATLEDGEERPEPVVTTPTMFRGTDPQRIEQTSHSGVSDSDFARFIVNLQRTLTHVSSDDNQPTAKMSQDETRKYYTATVKAALEKVVFPQTSDHEPEAGTPSRKSSAKPVARFDMNSLKDGWERAITTPAFISRDPLLDKGSVNTNLAYMLVVENYKHSKAIANPHNPAAEQRIARYAEELGQQMLDCGLIKEQDATVGRLPTGRVRPRVVGRTDGPNDDGRSGGGGGRGA